MTTVFQQAIMMGKTMNERKMKREFSNSTPIAMNNLKENFRSNWEIG